MYFLLVICSVQLQCICQVAYFILVCLRVCLIVNIAQFYLILYLKALIVCCYPVGLLTSNGRLLNVHIGPGNVQKKRLVDVPNETQLVRPNRTKMGVHFRPSRDAMHGTWTFSEPPPDVLWTSTGRPLDVIFAQYGAWTSFQTSIRRHI